MSLARTVARPLWGSERFPNGGGMWRGGMWASERMRWSVLSLFKRGEQGAVYDPSRITEYSKNGVVTDKTKINMFQDSTGTTPVLAAGDPVGLMLDTRLGLVRGTNNAALGGTWTAGTGGTVTRNADGSVTFTADTLAATSFTNTGGTQSVAGHWYECAITVDSTDATTLTFGPDGDDSFSLAVGDNAAMVAAVSGSTDYPVVQVSAGHTATISAASVVHVAGNHASQATSSYRPTYQSDGTLHWIKFDGVDDALLLDSFAMPTDFHQALAWDTEGDTTGLFWTNTGDNVNWAHVYQDASVDTGLAGGVFTALNSLHVNGMDTAYSTRNDLHDVITGKRVAVWNSTTNGGGPNGQWQFGHYPAGGEWPLYGKLYGMVWRDGLTATERVQLETYLALRAGLPWIHGPFTPANLFRYDEQGAWYDPSQIESYKRMGPELVSNGGFDDDLSGWSQSTPGHWQWVDGRAHHPATDVYRDLEAVDVHDGNGEVEITFDLEIVSGRVWLVIDYHDGSYETLTHSASITHATYIRSDVKDIRFSRVTGYTTECYVDNVSVREVFIDKPKVNMYQDSAGTKPVLLPGYPVGLLLDTRKGLVRGSESWANQTPTIVDYDGSAGAYDAATSTISNTAATLTSTSHPRFQFDLGFVSGRHYEIAGRLSGDLAALFDGDNAIRLATAGNGFHVPIDRTTGEFGGIIPADGSVLEINMDGTVGSITIDSITVKALPGNHASQATSAARPVYQSDGEKHWLQFDGVDDTLITQQFDAGIDKAQVFVGATRNHTSASILAEFGLGNTDHGHFYVTAPENSTQYGFLANGAATGDGFDLAKVGYSATPETVVLTGLANTGQGTAAIRKNGVLGQEKTTVDAGNFGNHKLHIGARNVSGYPFGGDLYGLLVRFADPLTDADIETVESHLARKSGATL